MNKTNGVTKNTENIISEASVKDVLTDLDAFKDFIIDAQDN